MTVDTFLFFTRMKEKGFTLLKARLQDLLTSLKTKLVFKKPTGKPKCKVDEYGNKQWCLHGKRHREDGPAIEKANGDKEWYLNGKPHREDGPACESADGEKAWYLNGYRHREDGPAREYASGRKEWFLHGKRHREDGPAVERTGGTKRWYLHGKPAHPEQIVDLQLSRGVFCYYNEQTETLHFDEST